MVELIRPEQASVAVELLSEAFKDYPLGVRAFENARRPRPEMLRRMFGFAIGYRLETGIPAFVDVRDGEVVGVATLSVPNGPEMPETYERQWEEIEADMTPAGAELFERYERIQKEVRPREPHVYLVAIGVRPDLQGQGIGRGLVEAVRTLADELPAVNGVALDTHDPHNVPKYEKMGFRVIAERDLMGLRTWYFWNGNPESSSNG